VRDREFVGRGLWRGIYRTLGRTAGGLVHAATFPVTGLDVPLPENGMNLWPYD
jgi:hypothetical protein